LTARLPRVALADVREALAHERYRRWLASLTDDELEALCEAHARHAGFASAQEHLEALNRGPGYGG
jgi:hypothetical protein